MSEITWEFIEPSVKETSLSLSPFVLVAESLTRGRGTDREGDLIHYTDLPVNGAARAFYSALATIVKTKHKFSPIMRTKAVPAGAPRLMFANWNPPNLMGTPGLCHRKQATGTLEQKAGCYGNEIGPLFSSHIGWYHNKAQPLNKA